MSATARKLLASFEKLDPKERRAVAVEIMRLVRDDGLEEELVASAAALFRGFDEEESDGGKRKARRSLAGGSGIPWKDASVSGDQRSD